MPESYLEQLFNLSGKAVLLTGAGGHIAGELSRALASCGCRVALADLRLSKAEQAATRIVRDGGVALPLQLDVRETPEWERTLTLTLDAYGRVDVLVNGAGINSPKPFFEIDLKSWNDILDTNLTGTMFGCQVVGEAMVAQKGGTILNIISASAGPPLSKDFAYSVSKAAVWNLTQNLAREFASSGVRVNALRPGFFPAEWNLKNFITEERRRAILGHTPMGRFGEPNELTGAVLWLVSDAASLVTGAEICVDGGFLAMTI
jgi:NAD(P)-dependent dehydrogenase (short-subunit alcohol dehydrogenase family)